MNDILDILKQMGITPTDADDETKKALLKSVGLPADVLDPKNVFLMNVDDLEAVAGNKRIAGISKGKEQNLTPEIVMKHMKFSAKEIKSLMHLKVNVDEATFLGMAPKSINRIGLLLALRGMKYSRVQNSSQGVEIITQYPDCVPQNARDYLNSIIRKQEVGKSGNATEIDLLDNNEKWIMSGVVSGNIAIACQGILKDYPDTLVRVKSDLDLRKCIDKKSELDDTFVNRIIVGGDLYVSKYSKTLPRKVQGTVYFVNLDKGDPENGKPGYINKDTVFPVTETIDCSYSLSGFDAFFTTDEEGKLVGTLPDGLKTLVVEPAFLKKDYIRKNLSVVLKFVEHYQEVMVVDTKGNILLNELIEICDEIDAKKTQVQEEKTVKPVERTTTLIDAEEKRLGTDLTVMDLLMYVRSIPEKYGKDKFSDKELRNLIKEALKYTNLTKKKVTDKEGNIVDTINFSEFNTFIANLDKVIEERKPKKNDSNSDGDVDLSFLEDGSLATQKMADLSHPAH